MEDLLHDNPDGVRFWYKHLLTATIFVALGVGLTVALNAKLAFMKTEYHVPYAVLEHVATALTIAGLWHIIHELFIKRDFIRVSQKIISSFTRTTEHHKQEILQHVLNARKDSKLGLVDTFHDVTGFSFSDFIFHPAELTIVLGDGYTWISSHIETLRDRINDKKKITKIFLIDPSAPAMTVVAAKMHMDERVYRERALLTVKTLEAEIVPGANLTVFGHHSVPHHSLYLGDRLAITPYYFSKKKRNPPIFIFEKGSYVSKVQADLNDLEAESVILLGGPIPHVRRRGAEQPIAPQSPPNGRGLA